MDNKNFEKKKKIVAIISACVFVMFMFLAGWYIGKPILQLSSKPEVFREWVASLGWKARFIFIGMVALQVVFAIIPGEPLEIVAGYGFGAIEGTILCLAGFFIGSAVIFFFVRKLGVKFVHLFYSEEKLKNHRFLSNKKKLNVIAYVLFLLPGTPKDIMVYLISLTDISPWVFFAIVTLARIPSVITSTIGGNLLGVKNYIFAAIVFIATILISIVGYFIYNYISKHHSKKS